MRLWENCLGPILFQQCVEDVFLGQVQDAENIIKCEGWMYNLQYDVNLGPLKFCFIMSLYIVILYIYM